MNTKSNPAKLNLIFGTIFFIAFIITGLYLNRILCPDFENEHFIRMEARANHIYILLVALMNIMSYRKVKHHHKTHRLEYLFRYLLVFAGLLSVVAFVVEHRSNLDNRSITFFTMLICLFATAAYVLHEGRNRRKGKVY